MIDLSFTKDPQWIEERQKKWDLIKEDYCDGLSKKQREQVYQYFMFGTPPKKYRIFTLQNILLYFPCRQLRRVNSLLQVTFLQLSGLSENGDLL